MAWSITSQLPGWEIILFLILVGLFLLIGGIVTFVILSRMRWPFSYVVLEDTSGNGYSISRRGKCRLIGFGDGGEEIFLLKKVNKYRIGYGKRIGPKQIAWVVASDGLWYQSSFGDFNKVLREIGLVPTSVNVRLGMASVRKGLDKRLEPKDFMTKYGPILYFGLFFLTMLLFVGLFWYSSNQAVKVAQINSASLNTSMQTQVETQKTLSLLNEVLMQIKLGNGNITIGGSGLIPVG